MKTKRWICGILLVLLSVGLCACDKPGYTKTAQTEAAVEAYLSAVRAHIARPTATITYRATVDDPVLEKKKTEVSVCYNYTVTDSGAEVFTLKSEPSAGDSVTLQSDGNRVCQILADGSQAPYKENLSAYLQHSSNPISSLQMFRMDANFKLQHNTISDIKSEQKDGQTIIDVTFDPVKLTSMVIKNGDGVQRTIVETTRRYVIADGRITHIEIRARQHVVSGKDKGEITTATLVDIV